MVSIFTAVLLFITLEISCTMQCVKQCCILSSQVCQSALLSCILNVWISDDVLERKLPPFDVNSHAEPIRKNFLHLALGPRLDLL